MPKGVYKRSEEVLEQMRLSSLGNKNTLGKHWKLSEESKRHIGEGSKSWKRKPISEEQKERLRRLNDGRVVSTETRIKIGNALRGIKKLPMSEETKRKIGLAMKGKKRGPQPIEQRIRSGNSHKGDKSWNWKGGITPENRRIRHSIDFDLWRVSVFARDNWTCQKCRGRNGNGKEIYLHPHHIKNFSQYPELRFAIDNGITLCKPCHIEFHHRFGRQNNTKEQIEEFLKQ
jgi:hypothetical protein